MYMSLHTYMNTYSYIGPPSNHTYMCIHTHIHLHTHTYASHTLTIYPQIASLSRHNISYSTLPKIHACVHINTYIHLHTYMSLHPRIHLTYTHHLPSKGSPVS